MSRKLDALFAERVLRREVIYHYQNPPELWETSIEQPYCQQRVDLPHYTQSLDAAWEGVERLRKERGLALELWDGVVDWRIMFGDGPMTCAEHPALAVVKACLLAAGCSREEVEGG